MVINFEVWGPPQPRIRYNLYKINLQTTALHSLGPTAAAAEPPAPPPDEIYSDYPSIHLTTSPER